MRGGVAIYRGAAAAARNYVEADRSRADDYYLAEGTGVAARYVATPSTLAAETSMDGDTYEQWVAGYDVDTGQAKGRLIKADNGVRFAEVVVNGPKTWSLAAALDPEISEAYDVAQSRAAEQIISWVAEHATTRVGPRDLQVQVPVELVEAAVICHHTSRAGDPHRHLHLQVNARVFAEGKWRGLHTVGVRDMVAAMNGIGHAAVMCDPQFRTVLARHGFTLDEDGEVNELAPYAGAFSARSAQVGRNIARYEAEWRRDHPDEEPGPKLLRTWDRRAWADARPDKVVPTSGEELRQHWVEELDALGFVGPAASHRGVGDSGRCVGSGRDRRGRVDPSRCEAVGLECRRHPRRRRGAHRRCRCRRRTRRTDRAGRGPDRASRRGLSAVAHSARRARARPSADQRPGPGGRGRAQRPAVAASRARCPRPGGRRGRRGCRGRPPACARSVGPSKQLGTG